MLSSPRTDHPQGELSAFPKVFRQTQERLPGTRRMIGDGGYSARWMAGMLHEAGVEARILPRRNVTLRSQGMLGWFTAHRGFITDPQRWLEEYR